MRLTGQMVALLKSAVNLCQNLPADAILLLAETSLDWPSVQQHLGEFHRVFVAVQSRNLAQRLRNYPDLSLIELEPVPTPVSAFMNQALLKAIGVGWLKPGEHVVVMYNGIEIGEEDIPDPIDTLSVIHLQEHLGRLTINDLRRLNTSVPDETLRLVINLASEIGREGREDKPVGTLFVVGDTRKVLSLSRPINFNPFRGYSRAERDLRDRKVREQIKDIAQLDGAIIISSDGIAVAACVYIDVPAEGIHLPRGLASRHITAAAVSKHTKAVAIAVSQSTGTVRLFHRGEVALHIEPLARPHIWQPPRPEVSEMDEEEE